MPIINNYLNEPNAIIGISSIRFSPNAGSSSFTWAPIASSSSTSNATDTTWTSFTISRTLADSSFSSSSYALTTTASNGISPFINRHLAYDTTGSSGFVSGTYTLGGYDRSGSYWTESGTFPLQGTTGGGFASASHRRLGTVVPFFSINALWTLGGSHVFTYRLSGTLTAPQNTGLTGTGPVTLRTEGGSILGFGVPILNSAAILGVSSFSSVTALTAMISRTTTSFPGAATTSFVTRPNGYTVVTGPANIAGISGGFAGFAVSIDYKANGVG